MTHSYNRILLNNKKVIFSIHAPAWTNLKITMLSERSQIKKKITHSGACL